MSREFYLNGEFDLSLGKGFGPEQDEKVAEGKVGLTAFIRQLSVHFLFAGTEADSVLIHIGIPDAFLSYLDRYGFFHSRPVAWDSWLQGSSRKGVFTPFGWNRRAMEFNRAYAQPSSHPELAVVEHVNARVFSLALEKSLFGQGAGCQEIGSLEALRKYLEDESTAPINNGIEKRWVVKGDHGSAGMGHRRLAGPIITPEDEKAVGQLLIHSGKAVVEPWQDRVLDMGTLFFVSAEGEVKQLRMHELINSQSGVFIGVKVYPRTSPYAHFEREMVAAADKVAATLAARSYFGPVSLDSYVWRDGSDLRLRSLVDLNARLSMAYPVHNLAERFSGKIVFWRLYKSGKWRIPPDYETFEKALGESHFDPVRRTGVLATSPLSLEDMDSNEQNQAGRRKGVSVRLRPIRPQRIGVLFVADSEDQLAAFEKTFSRLFARGA